MSYKKNGNKRIINIPSIHLNLNLEIKCTTLDNKSPISISSKGTIIITPQSTMSNKKGLFPNMRCFHDMDQIIPNLWLGEIISVDEILEMGFTHLLSIIEEFPNDFNKLEIKKMYIEIKDNSSENIYKYFDKCSDFIHNALNEKGKIYVHCKQGLSRSPSIVIAYIMKYGICPDISHIRFNEALEYVSKKRPNICPNLGFNLALRDYEKIFFPLTTA